jgi:hypothetical protein
LPADALSTMEICRITGIPYDTLFGWMHGALEVDEPSSAATKLQETDMESFMMRHTNQALWFLAPFLFVLLAPVSGLAQEACVGAFAVTAPGSAATSTCPADPATLDSANVAASDNALAQAQSICRLLQCGPPDPATTTTEAVQLLVCTTETDGPNQVTAQITIRATCSTPPLSRGRVPVPNAPAVPSRAPTPAPVQ